MGKEGRVSKVRLDCKHRRIYLLSIYYLAPSQAVGATEEYGIRYLSGRRH